MSDVFRKITDELGQLDVVCANAGTAGPTALIEEQSIEEFADCLDVNIKGAFYTARGALPMMKRQGSGSIIFYFVNCWAIRFSIPRPILR